MSRERNQGGRRRRGGGSEASRRASTATTTPASTRQDQPEAAGTPSLRRVPRRASSRPEWRERLDSYGGFTMLALVAALVAFFAIIVWKNQVSSTSDDALRGEEVALVPASHTSNPNELVIPEDRPPAGGPHYPLPQRPGIYDGPIEDGAAIHALEHGIIWISYNGSVSPQQIDALENVADDYGRDVILSPRPQNTMPIAIVSWGRFMRLEDVDEPRLKDFIEVNRNRSPEPNVR